MSLIIVNADDFGKSRDVNEAIVTCFSEGVISTATIMANMPAFEDACELAWGHRFAERLGIHINISEGIPLTDKMGLNRNFCDKGGRFVNRRHPFFLSAFDKLCLSEEIDAQIRKCRAQGLPLSHVDSHEHVHTQWPIFSVMCSILKEHGINRIRLSANVHSVSPLVRAYKSMFNKHVIRRGFATVEYFGDLEAFLQMKEAVVGGKGSFELMVHPGFTSDGQIWDSVQGYETLGVLKHALQGLELSTYSDLATEINDSRKPTFASSKTG